MSPSHRGCAHNAAGRFLVDDRCIACMICTEIAPEIFFPDKDQEAVFVGRQPVTEKEIARSREAEDICPVDAIGER